MATVGHLFSAALYVDNMRLLRSAEKEYVLRLAIICGAMVTIQNFSTALAIPCLACRTAVPYC